MCICLFIGSMRNLKIKKTSYSPDPKLLKLNHFLKKTPRPILKTTISLLPLFSKITERIVHSQTEEFLSKNKIICRFQSGFQKIGLTKNYSTNTCFGDLTDKITTGLEKGLFSGMILIDLQKVFGTIDTKLY